MISHLFWNRISIQELGFTFNTFVWSKFLKYSQWYKRTIKLKLILCCVSDSDCWSDCFKWIWVMCKPSGSFQSVFLDLKTFRGLCGRTWDLSSIRWSRQKNRSTFVFHENTANAQKVLVMSTSRKKMWIQNWRKKYHCTISIYVLPKCKRTWPQLRKELKDARRLFLSFSENKNVLYV